MREHAIDKLKDSIPLLTTKNIRFEDLYCGPYFKATLKRVDQCSIQGPGFTD